VYLNVRSITNVRAGKPARSAQSHFNDAGISQANFNAVTGLDGDNVFVGACATRAPQNLAIKHTLACENVMKGMTSVPADVLPETALDRCNRDNLTEFSPVNYERVHQHSRDRIKNPALLPPEASDRPAV
jgi:hypothetical protein